MSIIDAFPIPIYTNKINDFDKINIWKIIF